LRLLIFEPAPRYFRHWKRAVAAGLIAGGLIVAGGIWWLNRKSHQKTLKMPWA
jgi:hypothetical protein